MQTVRESLEDSFFFFFFCKSSFTGVVGGGHQSQLVEGGVGDCKMENSVDNYF